MKNKIVTHRDLLLGDTVDLLYDGWSKAKVIKVDDSMITLFRPWMDATKDGYPRIGVEIFSVYRDSSKTVRLLDREID